MDTPPPNLHHLHHNQQQQQQVSVPPFNANISPFGMHAPPHFNAPFQWHPPNDPAKIFDSKIDPKILAKAGEWTEHRAPDGRPYYFNTAKAESIWERPQALKDLDMARSAFMQQHPPNMQHQQQQVMTMSQGSITFDSSGNMLKPGALLNKQAEMEAAEKEKRRREETEKIKQQPAKPQDKTRPILSTPISGTPWW